MPSSLWNLVGEIGRELGRTGARGQHSSVIREMVAASAAKWVYSPYVCRSDHHTVLVTRTGEIFARQVQVLRLNSVREKLPSCIEMKPEKREYYHQRYRDATKKSEGEFEWFLGRWILNHFSVWSGKKDADDLEGFHKDPPLSTYVDTFGTTHKSADLKVHAVGGRFLTREIIAGLRDYVQWKKAGTPIFDRFDIPIDVPTAYIEALVVVDQDLFRGVEADEIANLALEFRNRETARFEGKEVAFISEFGIEELAGRALTDDGDDEILRSIRQLRRRVANLLEKEGSSTLTRWADPAEILSLLSLPQRFLFYRLKWPSPHLGIEVCVHWEKPEDPKG
jgi:hypothetical protein